MKRIPKGWIYRQYPKDFEAIVEGPNYEVRCNVFYELEESFTERVNVDFTCGHVSHSASSARYKRSEYAGLCCQVWHHG